ncbi:MAG: hypothetical protein ACE5LD_02060 [Candidatus Bipolaricaulia bacterium]
MSRVKASARPSLLGALLLLFGAGAIASIPTALTTYHGDATGWNNAQKIVADNSGTLHIVYQVSLTPARDRDRFAYARSEDGLVWEVTELEGRWPAIGTAGDVIYITFVRRGSEGDELWLYRLGGSSLDRQLILRSAPHSLFYPAIAVGDGRIHLTWEAHRGEVSSIEYVGLELFNAEPQVEVVAEGPQGLYFPSLAVAHTQKTGTGKTGTGGPDRPHLVWEEEVDPVHHQITHGRRGPSGWEIEPVSTPAINARYPALDYDPERNIYELVFVGYATSGNEIYYRALAEGGWGRLQLLSQDLEPGYWTFPTVEDGNVVWGRTVSAGCSIGPLYYSFLTAGSWSTPQALEGEFAAFPHLFRKGGVWHLIWTDRDPESPILRVIRYRQLQLP